MTNQSTITTTKALLFHTIQHIDLAVMGGLKDYVAQNAGLSVTVHDIKESPTGSVIGAGRLMSENDKEDIRNYLNGEEELQTKWLPENLLALNSRHMVWYVPAKKRPMYFRRGADKQIKIELWYPSLVFHSNGRGLCVAAYAGTGRPSLSQPLYHAPLWNINTEGHLCSGSADTTSKLGVEAMAIWEEAVFNTLFSHSGTSLVLADSKGKKDDRRYIKFVKEKALAGTKFKTTEMVSMKKTLQDWVNQD